MKLKKLTLAIGTILVVQPLLADEAELPEITVEGTKLSDVSGEEVKSADLADALYKQVPEISIVRRSGIANDIILRGQKKDNINVLIDDAKVYGACPNRMDPPTSHVLTNNIDSIEIIEGPYDVENFGTLSGVVKITTKKPSKELEGEVSVNAGRWGYRKGATTVSGGTDRVRGLVSISREISEQYEDGSGNNFAQQIENYIDRTDSVSPGVKYKDRYRNMDAYSKNTFMGKLYVDVTEDQELAVGYTANRSNDVLYPSSSMDALYDDSDILNLDYSINNLGDYSKKLDFQYYYSRVEHPMSTFYRNSSGLVDSQNEKVSKLTTRMYGFKAKNTFDLNVSTELMYGFDYSKRNWDGRYQGEGIQEPLDGRISIDDVDTENMALFVELDKDFADFNLRTGVRYDDTEIDPAGRLSGEPSNNYNALSGFLFGTYQASPGIKLFGGVGRSHRVPDARELYFRGAMVTPTGMVMHPQIGTPTLDETTNTEIDLGLETDFQRLSIKTKLFYSWLKDYIYYNADKGPNRFENIDATIYGLSVSGTYFATDDVYLDFGLAYQRGEKDEALDGQSDKDLAEIPPLKINLGMNYDYMHNGSARVELVAADDWTDYDSDNGEQRLDDYAVVNLKLRHEFARKFEVTLGVDNVFDQTYAVSNTYKDLTLLSGDLDDEVILMNEPGRYYYLNTTYKF